MSALAFLATLPPISPLAARLDRTRAAAVDDLVAADADAASASAACERLRRERSVDDEKLVDHVARVMLARLRGSNGGGRGMAAAARIDDALRSDALEYLDRDDVSSRVKRRAMKLLDRLNASYGSYGVWRSAVLRALDGLAPAHVFDLAAGTGGFARWLALHDESEGLTVTSSDIDPDYVALGERLAIREHARARRADVAGLRFEVRDALDLRGVPGVDLFLCTQATHHLSPGMVTRLIAQAIGAAPRGVLVIDLMRSLSLMLTAGFVISATLPYPPLVHDGVLSIRRSYSGAELRLFARLAGARTIDVRQIGPSHVALHAMGVAS